MKEMKSGNADQIMACKRKLGKKKKKRQCHQPIIILSCVMCYRVQVDNICLPQKNSGTHGEVALHSPFLIIPKLLLACPLVMLQH